jgi:hypothetical protein
VLEGTADRKRAGRKEYKEKDREDGGRMAKRRWRGRRDTRGINKEDDGEELGRESIWKRMEIVRRIMMRK